MSSPRGKRSGDGSAQRQAVPFIGPGSRIGGLAHTTTANRNHAFRLAKSTSGACPRAVFQSDAIFRQTLVIVDIAEDHPAVYDDNVQLQQVTLIPLHNAFHAISDVAASRRVVVITLTRPHDGMARIAVCDAATDSPPAGWIRFLRRSIHPNPMAWGSDCQSAARSWSFTAAGSGPRAMLIEARRSTPRRQPGTRQSTRNCDKSHGIFRASGVRRRRRFRTYRPCAIDSLCGSSRRGDCHGARIPGRRTRARVSVVPGTGHSFARHQRSSVAA